MLYCHVLKKTTELSEYKFFCFNGSAKCVMVCSGEAHSNQRTNDFYDMDFHHLPVQSTYPNANTVVTCPDTFQEMQRLAETLSAGIPHVRVDFYSNGVKIYFGELTFFHASGMRKFEPEEWGYKFGEWLKLSIASE